jgi:ABC-2 type transport system permease protein
MTATIAPGSSGAGPGSPAVPGPVPVASCYRFELVKLLSQWRIRLLIAACWIVPAVGCYAIAHEHTLPADTLYARWLHASGLAAPLAALSFAGNWLLPLVTSIIAGDVFSCEDRLGTWRHLLVAVRSPRRIFAAKALASLTVIVIGFPGLAVSATAGGIAASGFRTLTGMDGLQLTPGDALVRIAVAWLCALAPTLALAAIGLLGSVALGRSPMGLLIPAVVALGMQLVQDLPMDAALRLALPGYAFLSWNGLFDTPEQPGMVLIGVAVSLAWAVTATTAAFLIFIRREFTNAGHDGGGRRAIAFGMLPLAGLFAISAGALALAVPGAAGSGIDEHKVESALATEFANLYPVQISEIYHQAVAKQQLGVTALCDRGGGLIAPEGPGDDWRCTVSWHVPDVSDATGQAIYQLDVNPNGRFVADGDGPKEVNGYFLVHAPYGDAPNPLWQFDGNVDLLATPTKG